MEITKFEKCKEIVVSIILNYSEEIQQKIHSIDENTRLIGANSPFDSSDLIQIIVEIEDSINEEFNSNITLTDEKAMSRTTSPFLNVGTLLKFIIENL
jgi:hypothetical protein